MLLNAACTSIGLPDSFGGCLVWHPISLYFNNKMQFGWTWAFNVKSLKFWFISSAHDKIILNILHCISWFLGILNDLNTLSSSKIASNPWLFTFLKEKKNKLNILCFDNSIRNVQYLVHLYMHCLKNVWIYINCHAHSHLQNAKSSVSSGGH